jgi:hypothetical protein
MTLTMFDSTTVADIPSTGMDAVAGYVGGNWPTLPALVKRFPHLPALSIAVNASQDAQCLDVEKGDATAYTPAAPPSSTRPRHRSPPSVLLLVDAATCCGRRITASVSTSAGVAVTPEPMPPSSTTRARTVSTSTAQ